MSLQELLLSSSIPGERKINRHGVNFTYWCCGRSSIVTAGGLGGNPLMGVPVAVSAWGCCTWKSVPWGQTCLLGKAELPQLKAWIFREQRCWLLLINVQRKQRWTPLDSCFGVSELSASLVLAVEAFCFICLRNTPGCFSYLAAAPDIEVWDVRKVTHTASLEPPELGLGAAGGFGATFPSQQPQRRGTASLAWPGLSGLLLPTLHLTVCIRPARSARGSTCYIDICF